ncbi:MAG: hypothetical protein R3C19_25040 [Planctomycetaceae bacterium]
MSIPSPGEAFEAARDNWQTCDWATEFGPLKLRVQGLRSAQAERLALATSGRESSEWRKAAGWLQQIENTAAEACQLARRAVKAHDEGDIAVAAALIKQACELEAQWHAHLIWKTTRDAILSAGRSSLRVPTETGE